MIPVILAGGMGARLWPLSRTHFSKAFNDIVGNGLSLFQEAVLRSVCCNQPPIIVCGESQRFIILDQLKQIDVIPEAIILEPLRCNTAPSITLAALYVIEKYGDSLLLVLPSDHLLSDKDSLSEILQQVQVAAKQGFLVTLGKVPVHASTQYGYIKKADELFNKVHRVDHFVEKPNINMAESLLDEGGYLWNMGMFCFGANQYVEDLAKATPEIVDAVKKSYKQSQTDNFFTHIKKEFFQECPSDSIDYALLEKSKNIVVVEFTKPWADIGTWNVLHENSLKDADQNTAIGNVHLFNCHNTYVRTKHRVIAAVGVSDLIIADTEDVLLVGHKNSMDDLKSVVDQIAVKNPKIVDFHKEVHRPWGYYVVLSEGDGHQVKRLCLNPEAMISLQLHRHRSEHWVVVCGEAKVIKGSEVFILKENQSTFIPAGVMHRLENISKYPLEIIEVQTGSYLGEDDIERFEDKYSRIEVEYVY